MASEDSEPAKLIHIPGLHQSLLVKEPLCGMADTIAEAKGVRDQDKKATGRTYLALSKLWTIDHRLKTID